MNANCLMSFLKNYNRGREKSHSRGGRARRDSEGAASASSESEGALSLFFPFPPTARRLPREGRLSQNRYQSLNDTSVNRR